METAWSVSWKCNMFDWFLCFNRFTLLNDNRFSFGKNKVLIVSLGKKADDEYHQNLHLLSSDIKGNTALLFTSRDEAEVRQYLKEANDGDLSVSLQSLWKKDGTYKSFRKQKQTKQADDEEMEDWRNLSTVQHKQMINKLKSNSFKAPLDFIYFLNFISTHSPASNRKPSSIDKAN